MAGISYIGKPISLVSLSDIRYRGILHGIDPANSTISLANVISMGTEHRAPPDKFIPPSDVPYEFIVFRAAEVKDIAVDQQDQALPRQRSVHDDPAVMTASMPPPTAQVPLQQPSVQQPPPPAAAPPAARTPANDQTDLVRKAQNDLRQQKQPSSGRNSANRSINNATTSLENVQRAMGELHIRENGRGRGPSIRAGDMSIPTDEFDFASSNARFNKVHTTDDSESDQQVAEDASGKSTEKDGAYNPKASFFDSLGSSQANNEPIPYGGRGGGRGGRRGGFKREEERQKNVATFGEPGGGPGLLGPGAYVPGWRGNRRGQGRGGRRGMPRPNNVGSQ